MTLFMTTSVLLDLFGIRVLEGEYVEFIVWANFFSALGYLLSAWGFLKRAKWTTIVLAVVLLILIISFAALVILIYQGGNYETKTIYAMLFRIVLTLVFTLFSWKVNTNKKQSYYEN
ncbi:MAG: hypothetical protein HC819_13515 [Cyclobacteriaceae bacterium]|nr:hypothetical protein [Cyclobacteriaceae bacterium]